MSNSSIKSLTAGISLRLLSITFYPKLTALSTNNAVIMCISFSCSFILAVLHIVLPSIVISFSVTPILT